MTEGFRKLELPKLVLQFRDVPDAVADGLAMSRVVHVADHPGQRRQIKIAFHVGNQPPADFYATHLHYIEILRRQHRNPFTASESRRRTKGDEDSTFFLFAFETFSQSANLTATRLNLTGNRPP